MAIQTTRIARGTLAATLSATTIPQKLSNSSAWFESRMGHGPEQANGFVLSVLVESLQGSAGGLDELSIDLFRSGDLTTWTHVAELAGPPPTTFQILGPGLYRIPYSYPALPPFPDPVPVGERFYRIQFSVLDASAAGTPLPWPPAGIQFNGTCWVTVGHF